MQIWFVSERRRDLKYFFWCEFPRIFLFVSSRRHELKWYTRTNTLAILSSSPRGDVSWNTLTEIDGSESAKFVFLRRRELKYGTKHRKGRQSCSSPCGDIMVDLPSSSLRGDVNWNIAVVHIDGNAGVSLRGKLSSRRLRKPPPTRSRGLFHLIFARMWVERIALVVGQFQLEHTQQCRILPKDATQFAGQKGTPIVE